MMTDEATRQTGVRVKLTGTDGNVFALIGACCKAGRAAKVPAATLDAFRAEVMAAGSYEEALRIMAAYFEAR